MKKPHKRRQPPRVQAGVVDLPLAFTVQNVNRSRVACRSDGQTYVVRGHLVAPRALLAQKVVTARAVALYLHGSLIGESVWRAKPPGQDWALEQAKAGHVSVTIDQLGFGASGLPDGLSVCVGSWADVAHQIIGALRSGSYRVTGAAAQRFGRVALVGYCLAGLIAPVEAYSFGDIDALIVMSSAFDQGFSQSTTRDLFTDPNGPVLGCARGGEPKSRGGPPGYAYAFKGTEAQWFSNADPAVVATVVRDHEREPCGEGLSTIAAIAADKRYLQDIKVPVLLQFGKQDAIFPPPAGERQRALYTGSPDVTLQQFDASGHSLPLGRTAPLVRAAASQWLRRHGF